MPDATPNLAKPRMSASTVTGWTILFFVLLRIGIGWHLTYEGIWKLQQDDWRATPYLVASSGPFREVFRGMVKDPDGFERLTKESLTERMTARADLAVRHYGLDAEQEKIYRAFVDRKIHGLQDENNVKSIFADEDFQNQVRLHREAVARGETGHRALIVDRLQGLFTDLDDAYRSMLVREQLDRGDPPPPPSIVPAHAPDEDDLRWLTRGYLHGLIDTRYNQLRGHYRLEGGEYDSEDWRLLQERQHQSSMGWRYRDQKKVGDFRDRNSVAEIFAEPDYRFITGPPGRAIDINDRELFAPDRDFLAQLENYRQLSDQIARDEAATDVDYDVERLMESYRKKTSLRGELLAKAEGPFRDIDPRRIEEFGERIFHGGFFELTTEQLGKGSLPAERSRTFLIDWANMIGLTVIGLCLIFGFFTRFAALCGAVLLATYYLAMPPWPGLPPNPIAEGHYLIVDKNLIEIIALLMIASSRVGRWMGLDAFFARRRRDRVAAGGEPVPQQAPAGAPAQPAGRALRH